MKILVWFVVAITAITSQISHANEPLASARASVGFPTTHAVSGQIEAVYVDRGLVLKSAQPFWGPPRYGGDRVWLWPKGTRFIAQIYGRTPTTIDGAKSTTERLAAGQWALVQYMMVEVGVTQKYPSIYCEALRIDARSASRHQSSKR